MECLPYDPNDQQAQLIDALARFCSSQTAADTVFLLNGYAGTGKTSVTGALVKALGSVGIKCALLAPTGRAAKVFSSFAGHPAYTIHRIIFNTLTTVADPIGRFSVAPNRYSDTFFIVDEASMIGDDSSTGDSLLADLIHYVYSGTNCRLILLGDTAQLPPVGCTVSPAMDVATLRGFGLHVAKAVITETVRQTSRSGLLYNATWLRRAMLRDPLPEPMLHATMFDDVAVVEGEDLVDALTQAYDIDGTEGTILITRSNRRAVEFNRAIRVEVLGREQTLQDDDRLLIAKNNYFWSHDIKGLDFIANGDVATVNRIYGTEFRYNTLFADVNLHLPDYGIDFDCKLNLDTLLSETASLSPDEQQSLYQSIMTDPDTFEPSTAPSTRQRELKKSPYYNALQVKFAYAVTCHKSQGGQWRNVFVDMGGIPPEALGIDFYRWLYTAITRATDRLFIINPTVAIK